MTSLSKIQPQMIKKQYFTEKVVDTIQSTIKLFSCGKPIMEFLSQGDIYFLTPKIFKSMKFIGHCSSITKSFASNFASTVSTIGKLNNPEKEALQKNNFQSWFHIGLSFHVRCYISNVLKQFSKALPYHGSTLISLIWNW